MAVAEALCKLKKYNVAIERPTDYFAEMVKTDDHMQKVYYGRLFFIYDTCCDNTC